MSIDAKQLMEAGWKSGPALGLALKAAHALEEKGDSTEDILGRLDCARTSPGNYLNDDVLGPLAQRLMKDAAWKSSHYDLRSEPVRYSVWGANAIEPAALEQMDNACRLPVAVAGAQMPDGHVGYGLPIGGVLATRNAVIPYGVGVDIACRMKLSIMEESASRIAGWKDRLAKTLISETAFGMGAEFRGAARRDHEVMEDEAWADLPGQLRKLRDRAWSQLGSSGSGNHFVEFGELVLDTEELGLAPGRYLALLSHSGSRGLGANTAKHFTDLAMELCHLPKQHRHLAWLNLDEEPGQQYWYAMELAGRYASANHDLIHRQVLRAAGLRPFVQIENHHNFAWRELVNGEEFIVHRKGATPAGEGVLGIIPGSMGDPGYVVRGKGHPKSLNSAAHGAGRRMSRTAAKNSITRHQVKDYLRDRGVELLAGGTDEAPMAYKNIDEVMAAQKDLVKPLAKFLPRIVLMANDGTAED
ncbi:MAG: RtcB family protein [Candidatus Sumerlaeaceae bacterium]|nr:RtcB family protein [Candidatus Sumerlaeaceae bacterium]